MLVLTFVGLLASTLAEGKRIKCFDGVQLESGQDNILEETCQDGVTQCVKYDNQDSPSRPIDGVEVSEETGFPEEALENAIAYECGDHRTPKALLAGPDSCTKLGDSSAKAGEDYPKSMRDAQFCVCTGNLCNTLTDVIAKPAKPATVGLDDDGHNTSPKYSISFILAFACLVAVSLQ